MGLSRLQQELDKALAIRWMLESQLLIDPSTNRYKEGEDPDLWNEYQEALENYKKAREAVRNYSIDLADTDILIG